MRYGRLVLVALLFLVAAQPATVLAVDGPQTDIYYFDECGDEVGHKWKDCGNSAWQMTGTTAQYMLVVTFTCDTWDYARQYYNGCLTNVCQMTESQWIAYMQNTNC